MFKGSRVKGSRDSSVDRQIQKDFTEASHFWREGERKLVGYHSWKIRLAHKQEVVDCWVV